MAHPNNKTLGEICDEVGGIIRTGPFGSQLHQSDYQEDGLPVVMPKDIVNGKIVLDSIARIGKDDENRLQDHKLRKGDIVFARRGDVGRCSLIKDREDGWLCGTGSLRVSLGDKVVDPTFLFYYLNLSHIIGWIQKRAIGATLPNLNTSIIRDIPISYPPLPTQRRIADILSAYDDLIENNTRRIRILEGMAQAIYQEWFGKVDKESLPEGWEEKGLFDIAEITYGFPFASKLFSTEISGQPVIRIRDILGNSTNTYTTETADEKYVVKAGDILVGMDGDFHMCKWANTEAYLNQRVVRFRPKDGISKYFLFLAGEKPIHYFNQIIVGTTVAHLGDSHLKSIRIPLPEKKLLRKVKEILEPIYELEISLRRKNANLRQTRDLLLPGLVSGEIEV